MSTEQEDWRDVAGFYGAYSVSSIGRVRSNPRTVVGRGGRPRHVRGRIMRQRINAARGGYLLCGLRGDGGVSMVAVHRLVCIAFHGPPPSDAHQVRHLDGVPTNNHATNLCWGSPKENEADKELHGTKRRGEKVNLAVVHMDAVLSIRDARSRGAASEQIAADFGISVAQVLRICSGASWSWLPIPHEQAEAIQSVTQKESRRGGGRPAVVAISTIEAIRGRYAAGGVSYADLATEYGVSFGYIGRVVRGERR